MATDLTTSAQRDYIITHALRRLHVVASGASGTANQVTDAAHALNLIVKQFDCDSKLKMFHDFTRKSAAVIANDTSVSLAAGALTVEGAYYKKTSDSSLSPLKPITLQEYIESMNTDSTASTPEFYYVSEDGDRAAQITMFFYPKIEAAGTIYYWSKDKITTFTAADTQADFPDSWVRFLVLQLTADLSWEFGKTLEEIDKHYKLAEDTYKFLIEQQVQNTDFHKTDDPSDNSDRGA